MFGVFEAVIGAQVQEGDAALPQDAVEAVGFHVEQRAEAQAVVDDAVRMAFGCQFQDAVDTASLGYETGAGGGEGVAGGQGAPEGAEAGFIHLYGIPTRLHAGAQRVPDDVRAAFLDQVEHLEIGPDDRGAGQHEAGTQAFARRHEGAHPGEHGVHPAVPFGGRDAGEGSLEDEERVTGRQAAGFGGPERVQFPDAGGALAAGFDGGAQGTA